MCVYIYGDISLTFGALKAKVLFWGFVFLVPQSWSSQEEFPFLSSFALAVSQLNFLQIGALVPLHHKNSYSSKCSEAAVLEHLSPAVTRFKH